MDRCELAIDIGASSGRHIVGWIENGKIHTQEVYRFPNGMKTCNGRLCWDIVSIERDVKEGLRAAYAQGYAPISVAIDTWGVDFVLLNQAGEVVGDTVAYRDRRTDKMDELLEQCLSFEQHYLVSGVAKQSYNTVYQMMAVLREHPECAEEAADFLFMPEYLAYALTGRKSHEWTICSTSALCDANTHSWSETILSAAGLPKKWFATPIREPGHVLGKLRDEVAAEVGFQTTVIFPASHDTGSAYMAVPAKSENAAFLSSGTWSLMGTELKHPILSPAAQRQGFTNEGGYDGTTRFLKNIMGMWMLQEIHKEINAVMTFEEMAQAAARSTYPFCVDATDSRYLAPESMIAEIKAALSEQGAAEPQGIGDILRAVTMGLAVCYREAIRELEQLTGRRIDSINIVGGGSQNVVLNQMTADQVGIPVYAGPAEGTALGNLAAQMIQHGWVTSLQEFRKLIMNTFEIATYQPLSREAQ